MAAIKPDRMQIFDWGYLTPNLFLIHEEDRKKVASLKSKKAEADAKVTKEAKKAEAESVVKKLLAGGMSADEILEKLK